MGVTSGVTIDLSGVSLATTSIPISPSSIIGTKQIELTYTLVCVGVSNLASRRILNIQNNSLNAMYFGNAITVSKTTGILLAAGGTLEFAFDPLVNTNIYGIAVGVPASISILEV
jgi:hypothetical protein